MRRRVGRGVGAGGGRWGIRAWMVVRSARVLCKFFSVIRGEGRGEGDIHLLRTIEATNNIGRKYLDSDRIKVYIRK
jgi:hypothetical protein